MHRPPTIPYETQNLRSVSPRLGTQVRDLGITRPLNNRQMDERHQALGEVGVLFFRDQRFDFDSQRRFSRYFGELDIHADANSKMIAGEKWHSGGSCRQTSPLGSILHLHTVPPSGDNTLFVSLGAAHDALSVRLKTYLEGLTAFHSGERNDRKRNRLEGVDDAGRVFPSANHPVVIRHPISSRRGLYVNRLFTHRINELPEEESDGVLRFLFEHAEKPDFQIRFQWQPHSVAFWDNRAVRHLAIWDYFPHLRSGSRVTVKDVRLAA